jgi:hypothetical protein
MAVQGLTAVQRGAIVVLEWTNPVKAVTGRPLKVIEMAEVWVFDNGLTAAGHPLVTAEVEKTARLARRIPKEEFASFKGRDGARVDEMVFPYVFDPGPAGPKSLAFSVRVFDAKGRASDFSPPVTVEIVRENTSVDRSAAKSVCG